MQQGFSQRFNGEISAYCDCEPTRFHFPIVALIKHRRARPLDKCGSKSIHPDIQPARFADHPLFVFCFGHKISGCELGDKRDTKRPRADKQRKRPAEADLEPNVHCLDVFKPERILSRDLDFNSVRVVNSRHADLMEFHFQALFIVCCLQAFNSNTCANPQHS